MRKGKEVLPGEPNKKRLADPLAKVSGSLKIVGQANPSQTTTHQSPRTSSAAGTTEKLAQVSSTRPSMAPNVLELPNYPPGSMQSIGSRSESKRPPKMKLKRSTRYYPSSLSSHSI